MEGDIKIHAQVSVTTTAKLTEINVKGNCECEDVPPPIVDVIVLVDGSDSYNNKVSVRGQMEGGEAFSETVSMIQDRLAPGLNKALKNRGTITIVQFSGVKQLEKNYVPGSGGETGTSGLKHYNVELDSTKLGDSNRFNLSDVEGLDGNGQIFLVLQDLNMKKFMDNLTGNVKAVKGQKRHKFLIVFADEEWDCKHLKVASEFGGGTATGKSVTAINNQNYETFACIVRPNRNADQNEDFIVGDLCNSKKSNYKKVYTDKFDKEMGQAMDSIVDEIKNRK